MTKITAQVGAPVDVPATLVNHLRSLAPHAPEVGNEDSNLTQVGEDIWFTDNFVNVHTDSTEEGKDAFGVVLMNECGLLLYADGKLFPLPVGAIYRIDAHQPHAALPTVVSAGRFAVLIWDLPSDTSLEQFRVEVIERLSAEQQRKLT